jgi:hypothetical protein
LTAPSDNGELDSVYAWSPDRVHDFCCLQKPVRDQPSTSKRGHWTRKMRANQGCIVRDSCQPRTDNRQSTGEEDRSLYKSTLGTSQLHAISPSTGNSTARVDSLLSQSQVALLHTHHYFLIISVSSSSSSIPAVKQIQVTTVGFCCHCFPAGCGPASFKSPFHPPTLVWPLRLATPSLSTSSRGLTSSRARCSDLQSP